MQKKFTISSYSLFIASRRKSLEHLGHQEFSSKPAAGRTVEFLPGDAVIRNILNFSRALRVEKTKEMGMVEMLMN